MEESGRLSTSVCRGRRWGAAAVVAAALLSACYDMSGKGRKVAGIRPGMTRAEVASILGATTTTPCPRARAKMDTCWMFKDIRGATEAGVRSMLLQATDDFVKFPNDSNDPRPCVAGGSSSQIGFHKDRVVWVMIYCDETYLIWDVSFTGVHERPEFSHLPVRQVPR